MECDLCGGQLGQLQTTSFPISITAGQEHHGNFNPLIPEYLLFQIIVLFYFCFQGFISAPFYLKGSTVYKFS